MARSLTPRPASTGPAIALLGAIIAFALSGCSSSVAPLDGSSQAASESAGAATPASPASPTPVSSGIAILPNASTGRSCSGQPQPPGTPGTFSESNGGATFGLSFDGCQWAVTTNDQGAGITGTWTYSPATQEISFTETAGLCGPTTGLYGWSLAGSLLTMRLVSDPCRARSQQFAGYRWTRQP